MPPNTATIYETSVRWNCGYIIVEYDRPIISKLQNPEFQCTFGKLFDGCYTIAKTVSIYSDTAP